MIMFDSDDFAYPKTLEIYNHMFLKHPEVMGMCCESHTVEHDGNWVEITGGGHYDYGKNSTWNFNPFLRSWRNTIPEFDDGKLKWYQNDANIVRHVENKGKWLFLPRVLYKYVYTKDSFSKALWSPEELEDIENERLFIESKFPHLDNPDKVTYSHYYYPINYLARDFSISRFNFSKERRKVLKKKQPEEKLEGNLSVDPDGSGGGNTRTPPSRRVSMKKNWFFTLNNYTTEECGSIKEVFEKYGEKYHVGYEIGESGTPHLQGCIQLKTKMRLNEKINCTRIHWESMKGTTEEAMAYCAKEGNQFISKGARKPIENEFIKFNPHCWQTEIMDIISNKPDDRKIYVYIDELGGSGKSTFTRHLCLTRPGTIKVTGKGNDVKFILANALIKDDIDCVIWDLPRDSANYISYGALEEIKDGHICSGKYESCSIIFNRPHIIIFSNELPATERLSADKWVIRYINKVDPVKSCDDLEVESDL